MVRPYSSRPRSAMRAATPATGHASFASESPASTRPSTQPSRASRAVPASTASRPASVVPAMRRRTPCVKAHSREFRYTMQDTSSTGPEDGEAAGDRPHLSGGREPDRHRGDHAAPDRDPEREDVTPDVIVQHAGEPGPHRTASDRGQHQDAEDGAVMATLEDL